MPNRISKYQYSPIRCINFDHSGHRDARKLYKCRYCQQILCTVCADKHPSLGYCKKVGRVRCTLCGRLYEQGEPHYEECEGIT